MKKLLLVLIAAVLALTPAGSAWAKVTEAQQYKIAQSKSVWYDPSAANCGSGVVNGNNVTVIGDSISVGAKAEFENQLPGVDLESKTFDGKNYNLVEVSKHFVADAGTNYGGMTIAEVLQEQGSMRGYLVFALGTNDPGAVSENLVDDLVNLVGTNHKLVLVTNYAVNNANDYSKNNAALVNAAKKYKNVAVADWAAAAAENPAAYIGDNYVHPSAAGSQVFVRVIKEALNSLAGSVGGNGTGSNQNYAGAQVWSDAELSAIEANSAIYAEAAAANDVPWEVLAVLHSIETGLRRYNPDNGQGVYQLYSYTGGGGNANRFAPAAEISEGEFREQTMLVASLIAGRVEDWTDAAQIKKFFFSYNGQAEQYINKALALGFTREEAENGEGSPYVMNRYDAERDPTSGAMNAAWPGRFVADGVYDASSVSNGFGAFVKYEALAGSSYCSSTGSKIADTAILLSWDVNAGEIHDKSDPKPEYVEAMKAVDAYITGCNSSGCAPIGASCDQFVGTVMRYSGADPDFPVFGPATQQSHMDSHPDMYMQVEANEDVANLQAGDILVTNGANGNHIYLYIGEIDGQPAQASASFNDRTGEHFVGVAFRDQGSGGERVYSVYRRIN